MPTPPTRQSSFLQKMEELNDGRSLLANMGGFLCVLGMLGAANYICKIGLHIELYSVLLILIAGVAFYFFVPFLVVWLWRGRV
ncbi:MAG: hypothetical protein ACTIDN_07405 [Acetobacter sp.]|uniref:hypothetical protein n=1 Tax=Acetobacter sp. TaxID=440 RepID=UPI003F8FD9C6